MQIYRWIETGGEVMNKRIWVVGVQDRRVKRKFWPVDFPTANAAFEYVQCKRESDAELGESRKIKVQSYSVSDKWFKPWEG